MKLCKFFCAITPGLALLAILPAYAQTGSSSEPRIHPVIPNTTLAQTGPSGILSTVAGNGYYGYSGNGGPAVNAQMVWPRAVAVDSQGTLYIADPSAPVIRKVIAGTISVFAGSGTGGYSGDGGQAAAAELNEPNGVAVDSKGNVYIADTRNNVVRMVSLSGIISTVAGNGYGAGPGGPGDDLCGQPTDGVPATQSALCQPMAVAVDAAGNLFIVDTGHNAIRKVTAKTGIIATVAGSPYAEGPGDGGPAVDAGLGAPQAVAVDASGNIYIADTQDCAIRLVTAKTGIISSLTGNPNACWLGGDGGLASGATVRYPAGVAVDSHGNVYISDTGDNLIRIVSAANKNIYTLAGLNLTNSPYQNLRTEYEGGTGPARYIQLNSPAGLAIDPTGSLFFADAMNSVVREITYPAVLPTTAPVITPASGSTLYAAPQNTPTITAAKGATIYYTLDGSIPTTASNKYTVPLSPSKSAMITAFATLAGSPNSQVTIGTFFAGDSPTLSTGLQNVTITKPITVTMSDPAYPGTIYYTTDGQSPDHNKPDSLVYKTPIAISGTTYLQAVTLVSASDFDGNVFTAWGPATGVNITLAKAPVALTYSASSVAAGGAVLNGSVNPTGVAASYWFEYGTNFCAQTTSTASLSLAAGSAPVAVKAAIKGLTAGQQYCFKVAAKNAAGTTLGEASFFYAQ
ncbi:MAG: chitobiase/beta-hexosaminidase C-terminal domain-containing protein [Terracidiphilus sp.]